MLVGSLLSGGHNNCNNWSSFSILEYGRRAVLANSIIAQYVVHTEVVALSYSGPKNSSGISTTGSSALLSSLLLCDSLWSQLLLSVSVLWQSDGSQLYSVSGSSLLESVSFLISQDSSSSVDSCCCPEVLESMKTSELDKNLCSNNATSQQSWNSLKMVHCWFLSKFVGHTGRHWAIPTVHVLLIYVQQPWLITLTPAL